MITRKIVSFDELDKSTGFWDTLCGLVHEESGLIDIVNDISNSELHQVYAGDKPIGFMTKDYHDDSLCEIHAYIYPEHRRYSIRALKEMEENCKENIVTSVWGTHSHVLPILERMGFIDIGVEHDELRKDGKSFHLHYLYKEKCNG